MAASGIPYIFRQAYWEIGSSPTPEGNIVTEKNCTGVLKKSALFSFNLFFSPLFRN